ncbi:MAG: hypothetical protein AAB600_04015 [Patescibacteria group bacterium]
MNFVDTASKTNWKYVAIVVVLGLVASSGIVWYANPSTPLPQPIEISNIQKPPPQQTVDTSSWQTYRNEGPSLSGATEPQGEFGFEVKYPSKFYLKSSTDKYPNEPAESTVKFLFFGESTAGNGDWVGRILLLMRRTDRMNVRDLGSFINTEYVQIGPLEALKFLPDTQPQSATEIDYKLIHEGKEYDFQVISKIPEVRNDLDQILSTFRFIP